MAARGQAVAPVRRAARYGGLALLAVTPERFAELVDCVHQERGSIEGFDFVVWATPDYSTWRYERLGATWVMHEMSPFLSVREVMARIATGMDAPS